MRTGVGRLPRRALVGHQGFGVSPYPTHCERLHDCAGVTVVGRIIKSSGRSSIIVLLLTALITVRAPVPRRHPVFEKTIPACESGWIATQDRRVCITARESVLFPANVIVRSTAESRIHGMLLMCSVFPLLGCPVPHNLFPYAGARPPAKSV